MAILYIPRSDQKSDNFYISGFDKKSDNTFFQHFYPYSAFTLSVWQQDEHVKILCYTNILKFSFAPRLTSIYSNKIGELIKIRSRNGSSSCMDLTEKHRKQRQM